MRIEIILKYCRYLEVALARGFDRCIKTIVQFIYKLHIIELLMKTSNIISYYRTSLFSPSYNYSTKFYRNANLHRLN
jgi:hypothetical protein